MNQSGINHQKTATDISLLILDEATMLTVASILDPLRAANRLSRSRLFRWKTYSPDETAVQLVGDFEMRTAGPFDPAKTGDVLIVIASFNQHKHADTRLLQTLRRAASRFDIICGIEAGTWLLARSGVATNQSVTTHWEDFESLALAYPDLDVRRDRYRIDGRIWTCGGASPALDMMLKLIEMKADKSLALEVASVFIYDQTHASTDSQPSLSLGQLEMREPRLATAVRLMEDNIDTPLPVSAIAKRTDLSAKMLEILFRKHLDTSPGEHYSRLRLMMARKLVLDTTLTIHEISIRAGFSSQSAFSRSFRRAFETSPSSLRLDRN